MFTMDTWFLLALMMLIVAILGFVLGFLVRRCEHTTNISLDGELIARKVDHRIRRRAWEVWGG